MDGTASACIRRQASDRVRPDVLCRSCVARRQSYLGRISKEKKLAGPFANKFVYGYDLWQSLEVWCSGLLCAFTNPEQVFFLRETNPEQVAHRAG